MTPNEHELALLAGRDRIPEGGLESAARDLLDRGVGEVIVTMGSAGVVRFGRNETMNFPARRAHAVDTTGAGDAFNAGLAAGLASGNALDEAIALGIRAGAFCVTRVGVVPGLPTREQLDAEVPQ